MVARSFDVAGGSPWVSWDGGWMGLGMGWDCCVTRYSLTSSQSLLYCFSCFSCRCGVAQVPTAAHTSPLHST